MKIQKTSRGFSYIKFEDSNGEKCSLQKSSSIDDDIWLGVDNPILKTFTPGKGWNKVTLPPDSMLSGRMHLTKDQVKVLLPYLNNFVETGEIDDIKPHELPTFYTTNPRLMVVWNYIKERSSDYSTYNNDESQDFLKYSHYIERLDCIVKTNNVNTILNEVESSYTKDTYTINEYITILELEFLKDEA